jgi:hypothetical protein
MPRLRENGPLSAALAPRKRHDSLPRAAWEEDAGAPSACCCSQLRCRAVSGVAPAWGGAVPGASSLAVIVTLTEPLPKAVKGVAAALGGCSAGAGAGAALSASASCVSPASSSRRREARLDVFALREPAILEESPSAGAALSSSKLRRG